jgi:hypothetical protein
MPENNDKNYTLPPINPADQPVHVHLNDEEIKPCNCGICPDSQNVMPVVQSLNPVHVLSRSGAVS